MPTCTPWGYADTSEKYIRGINWYSTPSHGGFHVCPTLNATVPDYMRCKDGWYEEDCDWCIVAIIFPHAFTERAKVSQWQADHLASDLESARNTFRNWKPDAYERFYGVELKPGESMVRDEENFYKAHANDWLVTCARGDWAEGVPAGMVGVCAVIGGRWWRDKNRDRAAEERTFLVPAAEYKNSRAFSFIVDPARHQQIEPLSGRSKPQGVAA